MSRLSEIREAVFSEDYEALHELLSEADENDLNLAMFGAVLISNSLEMLELVLNAGANINHQDNYGRTALFLAVKYNCKAAVEYLIKKGCDVQLAKYNESNVLHLAAKKGDPDIVQMLIDAGHSVNIKNWGGNTALLVASRFGNISVVDALLNSPGCLVDDGNRLHHTALHYACFQGSGDIVGKLLSCGANPNGRTHLNISPIMLACEQDHCNVVSLLADKCNLTSREKLFGAPVLHWAVASGCIFCVRTLIDNGASMYTYDQSGRSPLVQAVISDKSELLWTLLQLYEHEDFMCGKPNEILLHVASFLGRSDCIEVLCESNKTSHLINYYDCFSDTPLDLAVKASQCKAISILVKYGAFTSKKLDVYRKEKVMGHDSLEIEESVGNLQIKINEKSQKATVEDAMSNSACKSSSENPKDLNKNGSLNEAVAKSNNEPSTENNANLKQLLSSDGGGGKEKSSVSLISPVFKTYSPVKMSMIELLKSVSAEQMVARERFDFNTWLDNGPEAFVLKVVSLDITDWLYNTMYSPWSLRELCRGKLRLVMGYRAHEKIQLLPIPGIIKNYLNMKELEDINTKEMKIRNTHYYDVIDVE